MKILKNLMLFLSKGVEKIFPAHQGKLLLLTLILLLLTILSNLPYFNILLTVSNITWIIILLSLFAFHIQMKSLLIAAIFFIGIALVSVLLGNPELAEVLGNSIYLVFIIVFISGVAGYLKETKRQ